MKSCPSLWYSACLMTYSWSVEPLFSISSQQMMQRPLVGSPLQQMMQRPLVGSPFEPLVQQRRHLGGIRLRRTGRQIVALLVADARLGGVRNGDLQLRREEIRLVFRIVHIGIERIHDALHQPHVLLGPFVLDALQIDVVHVVLPVHQVDHPQHLALGVDDRLANGHACIHDALLVGDVDLPVHEGSQEVAFAELQDANGAADRFDSRLVQLLDHCMSGF